MRTTTFQIKSIKGKHTCAHRIENKQANYKYIGKRIQQFVKDNPSEGLQSLKNKIRRDIQVDVSLFKVYRAKRFAVELMKGDIKQQYNRLYDYCATVCKHNPESSMILKVDRGLNPPVLQRMYCCFGGLKKGFLDGCRPFIGLDGCFLKGMHKGQLLSAIGRDGNDNIYPIAMAYVEIEKFDSWEWFINLLLRDIGSHNERGWAFISDRQKGLIEAVTKLAPQAEHRFCLRHMYNNFKVKFKGQELKKLFWKATSTYNVKEHLRVMKEIERVDPKRGKDQNALEWLNEIPAHHWARCFFPNRTMCDVVVNNMMAAIQYHRQNLEDFVHPYFKKDIYLRVYSHMINPVPGIHDYEESPLGLLTHHILKAMHKQKLIHHHFHKIHLQRCQYPHFHKKLLQKSSQIQRCQYPHFHKKLLQKSSRFRDANTPFSQETAAESFPISEMPTPPFSQETAAESFPISEHIPQQMPAYRPQHVPKNPPRMPASRPPRSQNVTFQMPQNVPQHVPQNVPRPQNVHPQISSTTSSCSQNKAPPKASRKQKAPISLSSKLEKRKVAESSSENAFKRQCCPPNRTSISSVLKGVTNSYKPKTQSGGSSTTHTPRN
ncbi:hypothetical protein Sango_1188500 [Sesamum angolense]|uniref:MULE transposase domain-containing protein n=1 Tax=Sesamum angolense TaxID=2727404 RepID=A0AAE1WW53_9LAMI|nr:hypothetical protein Sango_1188500 [Sesamum angolense]